MPSPILSNVQGVERALDSLRGTVSYAHIYAVTDSLEEAIEDLLDQGFMPISHPRKRYIYAEQKWVTQAEYALGGVAVHLRCPA